MSYCRWSSNGYQCDLYCYEDVAGCYTIHVAVSRYTEQGPLIENYLRLEKDGKTWNTKTLDKFSKAESDWMKEQRNNLPDSMIKIELDEAGESYRLGTLGEFRDKVAELIETGFVVPDGVLGIIDAEIEEFGKDLSVVPADGVPEEEKFK